MKYGRSLNILLHITIAFIFAGILILPARAYSADSSNYGFYNPDRQGKWSFSGSIGFTLNPDAFLFAPSMDYFLKSEISIGPNLQFAVSERLILLAPSATVKYYIDIDTEDWVRRLKPVVQAGLGLALTNFDVPGNGTQTDIGALINFGFGFDIFLNDKISFGNHMIFNITTPMIDDRFFFSWHFVKFKYYF